MRRAFAMAMTVLLLAATPAAAAPKASLWGKWTLHDPASTFAVDHAPWQAFLTAYVGTGPDGINRVAYGHVTDLDAKALAGYIAALEAAPVSRLDRPQQLALWINLYNALTVKTVLDHFPVAGIRDIDISPGLFADGPWGKKLATVEGEAISLDDIEHRILRPIWKDPRIHYAVNCAALGCPNLRITAFTAGNADALLTDAARDYVNHPRGVSQGDGPLIVSSLYDWYRDDFGGTDETVIAHLKRYAEGATKGRLDAATRIDGYAYDWALNTTL